MEQTTIFLSQATAKKLTQKESYLKSNFKIVKMEKDGRK